MEILYRGAEAVVYIDSFDGEDVLVKERTPKKYRVKELDEELRKLRTRKEVKLLTEARKLGISTPKIFSVDEKSCKIVMEFVKGEKLRDYLNAASKEDLEPLCRELGRIIGKLHASDIVHGDLTTSNMILSNGKIYMIDFSLGDFTQRIEDKGVDLKLLKEAVKSTHFQNFNTIWSGILAGYKSEYKNTGAVLQQLTEIEKRARYANRE
ncbi:MAG: Kae1-associated serine/threonine protein kinase [Candidatus Aenigmarchaeota archaeon]|nr:Kae1-associated serine/threonine protein kinase [Candidatus Aenigmarchaeota archaeon]